MKRIGPPKERPKPKPRPRYPSDLKEEKIQDTALGSVCVKYHDVYVSHHWKADLDKIQKALQEFINRIYSEEEKILIRALPLAALYRMRLLVEQAIAEKEDK